MQTPGWSGNVEYPQACGQYSLLDTEFQVAQANCRRLRNSCAETLMAQEQQGLLSPLANGKRWGQPCWLVTTQSNLPTNAASEGHPDLEGAVAD